MKILIKGAGDLATGIAHRLNQCGFQIVMTEIAAPTTVRRTVAFSAAVYQDEVVVEGVKGIRCSSQEMVEKVLEQGNIAVLVDPMVECLSWLKPDVVVDAIIAKKNLGTTIDDAAVVIALGPGFRAGQDCHCVVETMRGHYLGRCIYEGEAEPNTGVPGSVGGYTTERLIRASADGTWITDKRIGDEVQLGEVVAKVNDIPVVAQVTGTIRGLLPSGMEVAEGMKAGDIDPRCKLEHCFTISDKARSIGGGVLEGILYLTRGKSSE